MQSLVPAASERYPGGGMGVRQLCNTTRHAVNIGPAARQHHDSYRLARTFTMEPEPAKRNPKISREKKASDNPCRLQNWACCERKRRTYSNLLLVSGLPLLLLQCPIERPLNKTRFAIRQSCCSKANDRQLPLPALTPTNPKSLDSRSQRTIARQLFVGIYGIAFAC